MVDTCLEKHNKSKTKQTKTNAEDNNEGYLPQALSLPSLARHTTAGKSYGG
jgi:hypothetical protein